MFYEVRQMGQPDKPQAMAPGPAQSTQFAVRGPQRIVAVIAHTPVIDIECPATCNTPDTPGRYI